MKKLKFTLIKNLPKSPASKWQSQDLNPGPLLRAPHPQKIIHSPGMVLDVVEVCPVARKDKLWNETV